MSDTDKQPEARQEVDPQNLDPKERMRAALEAKKAATKASRSGRQSSTDALKGAAHGPAAQKRMFRRKSGG